MFMTLLENAAADQKGMSSGAFWIFYIVLMLGMVYLLIIRPNKKQRKAQEDLHNAMEPGDTVMTTGGFYGTLLDIMEDGTVIVEFGNNKNCRIPMHPNAIAEVEKAGSAVVKDAEDEKKESKKDDAEDEKKEDKKEEKKLGKVKK